MEKSVLYYGDNLPILRNTEYFPSASVDLVYLDPPFNSNQDFNVLFAERDGSQSAAQIRAFTDTWRWDLGARRQYDEVTTGPATRTAQALLSLHDFLGENDMLAYLSMMAPRLVELRRVLRDTGSIYLHCDPTASHYLKVLMDSVFGPENLLNEIVWKRASAHSGSRRYGPAHDVILFYSKGPDYAWYGAKAPQNPEYLDSYFRQTEPDTGRHFQGNVLTGAGVRHGESGLPWKGYDPTVHGRHWALPGRFLSEIGVTSGTTQEKLDALEKAGRVIWPEKQGGQPRLKYYADELPEMHLTDVWTDVHSLQTSTSERLGYPTQKPEELLERIISASTQDGDTVLDPFCGCGTTISVAQRLRRRWIGIDVTHLAITLIRSRLADAFPTGLDYRVIGEPADLRGAETLAKSDRYQFQWWALGVIGAGPVQEERRKGADSGIDGKLFFREKENGSVKTMVIQVKSGGLKLGEIRDFGRVIEREKAQLGVLLTLDEPTRDMRMEAATLGFYKPEYRLDPDAKYDRYQILTINELFDGKRPQYPPFRNVTFRAAPVAKSLPKKPKVRANRLPDS